MRNPLNKRLPRELKREFGKYAALFIFLAGMIGLVSGFLVASGSMIVAYDESFEKYQIEDGNFELSGEASADTLDGIEKDGKARVYPNFYIEEETKGVDSTLRIFKNRTEVDLVCLMDGKLPKAKDEIAIDRMYADNNGLKTGDRLKVGDQTLKITGLVALSDYSALFSDTSDMMFDAVKFGVAVMTEDGFDTLNENGLHYSYSWRYDDSLADDTEAKDMAETFLKQLTKKAEVKNFIPEYLNQAIIFTGDDLGSDNQMFTVFLYVVVVIIAFVFAITISNTITKEAAVIGTLRASGYTRGELISHYMTMPMLVMLAAALVGNVLGYSVFKDYMAGLYYNSYSLPTYVTLWNAGAFLKTTAAPLLILFVIDYAMLKRKLSLSPLKFMRRDLSRRTKEHTVRLSEKLRFMTRFRLRVIFQNMPNYVTIFIGVAFANFILLFGLMFGPLLDHYEEQIKANMISKYQYVLRDMESGGMDEAAAEQARLYLDSLVSAETEEAEPYSVTSLKTQETGLLKSEDVTVYGVDPDSDYMKLPDTDSEDVVISNAFAEKYGLRTGDTVTLKEPYDDGEYRFTVVGIYEYPSSIAVFMEQDAFNEIFDKSEGYFNGYFSEEKLTELPEEYIQTTVTLDDLDKTCRQLKVSMGGSMVLFQGFGVIMFALILALLSRIIIEKNAQSVSMVKILGYRNREISGLYVRSTTLVTLLSVAVTIPLDAMILEKLCKIIFSQYSGWLPYYVPGAIYAEVLAAGVITYGVVALFQMRRVQRISMTDALKNIE